MTDSDTNLNTNINNKKARPKFFYVFLILCQGSFWGLCNGLLPYAYREMTPLWLLSIRFILTFLLFLPFFGRQALKELKKAKLRVWLPAAIFTAGAYGTSNLAFNTGNVTAVGFLISLSIVFTPFLGAIILKEKIRFYTIPLVLLAITGLNFLCMNGGSFRLGTGEILSLACSFCMAGALVFGKDSLKEISTGTVCICQGGATAILALVFALIIEAPPAFGEVSAFTWGFLVYLVIFPSFLAYLFQNIALKHISSTAVSLTQCSEPMFTSFFAHFTLGERLTPYGKIGCLILFITMIIGNLAENRGYNKEKKAYE